MRFDEILPAVKNQAQGVAAKIAQMTKRPEVDTTWPTHVVCVEPHLQDREGNHTKVLVTVVKLDHQNKTYEPLDGFNMNVKKYPREQIENYQGLYLKTLKSKIENRYQDVKSINLIPFGDNLDQVFVARGSSRLIRDLPYADYRNAIPARLLGLMPNQSQ